MIAFRFIPFLLVLGCVQLGLYLTLRELFLPRPDQARARRWLAGVQIARRTVAKYRDQLGVLSARMRKRV